MKKFESLSNKDFKKIAADVIALSKRDETELYSSMGHALHDLGLIASPKKDVFFDRIDKSAGSVSALKAFRFVSQTTPLKSADAEKKGRKFFERFAEKLNTIICSSQAIKDVIDGTASLKDNLKVLIPLILSTIGGGIVLGPVYISLIAAALAMIIKSGLRAYCNS